MSEVFQFTLSREERPASSAFALKYVTFQFTLSREERLPVLAVRSVAAAFQFTLSREERHRCGNRLHQQAQISIHALTRRATKSDDIRYFSIRISIHALTRRATLTLQCVESISSDFNSRSHEKSDRAHEFRIWTEFHFNSRSHEKSDCFPYIISRGI